jgi:hypothetical protein
MCGHTKEVWITLTFEKVAHGNFIHITACHVFCFSHMFLCDKTCIDQVFDHSFRDIQDYGLFDFTASFWHDHFISVCI